MEPALERRLVLIFCAVAAFRVFVLSAAFPFFNNIDEAAQFDVVTKYSHSEIPRSLNGVSAESAAYLSTFASPEYANFPQEEISPPPWTQSPAQVRRIVQEREVSWRQHLNYEALGPPLYYFVAGLWLALGRILGMEGGFALYWIRFLNVSLAAILVWIAFATAKLVFPNRPLLRLGVPLLVAIWPQDAFYSIQSDVLSPVCFGLAFLALGRLFRSQLSSLHSAIVAGMALASTFLVKVGNLALVAAVIGAVILELWRLSRKGELRAFWPAIAFFSVALLPMGIWCIWNLHDVGDLTASSAKIQLLGWKLKPISQWWMHPIFSVSGLWMFWSELLASFWRGEFIWRGQRLSFAPLDFFYAVSSTLFIGSAVIDLRSGRATLNDSQRRHLGLAVASFIGSVVLLALLSIMFDFGECVAPSRACPFFSNGRLLSGAVIPVMLLYVYGFEVALRRVQNGNIRLAALIAISLLVTVSEIALSLPVFSSPYNLFHM